MIRNIIRQVHLWLGIALCIPLVLLGLTGSVLVFEDELRSKHSLTCGHWPQSIALSTVGGWLACRGAGQFSTRYGKIEDIVDGTVTLAGEQAANPARLAVLLSGFPVKIPGVSLNRMCGSSQQAVHFAAQAVAAGDMDYVVASGVDVLIVSASRDGPPALATNLLRHPVLAALSDRTRVVVMPGRLWNCGGPAAVEAIGRLRHVADDARARAPAR